MIIKNGRLVVEMKAEEGFVINSGFISESSFDAMCEDTDFEEAVADEYDGAEPAELSVTPDNLYFKIGDELEELSFDENEINSMFNVRIDGKRMKLDMKNIVVIPVLTDDCDVDDEEIEAAGMVRIEHAMDLFPSKAAYERVRKAYAEHVECFEEYLAKVAEGAHMFFTYDRFESVTGESVMNDEQALIMSGQAIDASKLRAVFFASQHIVPWADRFTDLEGDLESLPFAPCGVYLVDVFYDDTDLVTGLVTEPSDEPSLNVVVEYTVEDEPVAVCC